MPKSPLSSNENRDFFDTLKNTMTGVGHGVFSLGSLERASSFAADIQLSSLSLRRRIRSRTDADKTKRTVLNIHT